MDTICIYVRVKNKEQMEKIELHSIREGRYNHGDVLWESAGEYYLEAYQCGANPSICSIEKDPRILNPKEEIALQVLDEIKKIMDIKVDGSFL